ncbi:MAG: hypothetical protein ABIT08_13615 [Bacteroidia bacterium]
MTPIKSQMISYFKDDRFCIQFAKTLYPKNFDKDESFRDSAMQRLWLTDRLRDTVRRQSIDRTSFDFCLYVEHHFTKTFKSRGPGWDEVVFSPECRTTLTGPMNIIVRDKIQCPQEKFIKGLLHYRANCLLIKEIIVGDLSIEQIRKIADD